jgi:hypothetical protein
MQEVLNWSVSGTGKFDDEITLPLRIICERKSEAAGANPREDQKTKDARDRERTYKEVQKLVRAS